MAEILISAQAMARRRHWIGEIVQIGDHFGQDTARVEAELVDEVRQNGPQAIRDHLRLCGAIPESYGHDTSEEKLYSKYTDALLAVAFRAMGMKSLVLTERADAADVEVFADDYSFVADAKVFRLSRTAKNQKDFKVAAMHNWKRGKPYAVVVCPLYQLPVRSSQIYQDASARNVSILSYSHISMLVTFAERSGGQAASELLRASFDAVKNLTPSKDAISYWAAVNRVFRGFAPACDAMWQAEKAANLEAIAAAKDMALTFLAEERERVMRLSHEQALQMILDIKKIGSREATIRGVSDGGIMTI
jgi:type II restriction enzyme